MGFYWVQKRSATRELQLAEKERELQLAEKERELQLAEKERELAEMEKELAEKEKELAEKELADVRQRAAVEMKTLRSAEAASRGVLNMRGVIGGPCVGAGGRLAGAISMSEQPCPLPPMQRRWSASLVQI